jgi:Domain of Unknown Function (DUF928)
MVNGVVMLKSILPLWMSLLIGGSTLTIAQFSWLTMANAAPLDSTEIQFKDPVPPNQGAPEGRQRGGASRKGPCDRYRPLAALIPNKENLVFSKTTSAHPTFWFYLPEPLTPESSLQFVLLDAQDPQANYVYRTTLKGAEVKPGLIRLSVPATAPAIAVDKPYLWTLTVACNAKPADAVFVQGITQRAALSPKLQTQLTALAPLDRAKLYAANGIWQDALDTVALQRRAKSTQPQALAAWNSLLKQVGLQDLADLPLTSCCTVPRSPTEVKK